MTQGQVTDNKERDHRCFTPLPRQYEVQKKLANHAGQEDSDNDGSSASSDSQEDDIRPLSLPAYNRTAMANIARALEDLSFDDVERQANLIIVDNDASEDKSLTTNDEEQSLSSASTNPSIANVLVTMAATVRTGTRDIHIEERLGMNLRALLTSMMPRTFYCISNVGADTTIFGDGWVVIGFSRRCANLIRFDHKAAKKKNLPICSAITVVETPNGKVLLKAHEGV
jgi:hypothetical protein